MQYLTIQAAADALSVSPDTIRRMLPKLGAVDLRRGQSKNRCIRIPVEAIENYLRSCLIQPPMTVGKAPQTDWHISRRR